MNLLELLATVYSSLTRHIVRSLLAVLGIVLGIAAVVAMLAIGEGGRQGALKQIEAQGINNIILSSVAPKEAAGADRKQVSQTAGRRSGRYGITARDADHIGAFANIETILPLNVVNGTLYAGPRKTDVRVLATTADFLAVCGGRLADSRSRFFSPLDATTLYPACVIGKKAARTYFDYRDPLGATVNFRERSYRVVGILENPSGTRVAGGIDPENALFIDIAFARGIRSRGEPAYTHLYLRTREISGVSATAGRLKTYLAATHDKVDYEISVPLELLNSAARTQRIFTVVMTSIAAISLLVGGIGIMNIMLANIFERTREIGVRRALGARRKDVIRQFLAEATLLTFTGGCLGAGLGILTARGAERIAALGGSENGLTAIVTPESLVVSLLVAVGTGLTFGTYPAWKASRLDPLTALRHE